MVYHEVWMQEPHVRAHYKGMYFISLYNDKPAIGNPDPHGDHEHSQGLPQWLLTDKQILDEAMTQHQQKAMKLIWVVDLSHRRLESLSQAKKSHCPLLTPSLTSAIKIVIRKSRYNFYNGYNRANAPSVNFGTSSPVHGFSLGETCCAKMADFVDLLSPFPHPDGKEVALEMWISLRWLTRVNVRTIRLQLGILKELKKLALKRFTVNIEVDYPDCDNMTKILGLEFDEDVQEVAQAVMGPASGLRSEYNVHCNRLKFDFVKVGAEK